MPIKLSNCCFLLFPILLQVQFRSSLGTFLSSYTLFTVKAGWPLV